MKKKTSIRCSSLHISSRLMIFVFIILLFVSQSILLAEIETGSFDFDERLRNYMVYLPNNYTGSIHFPLVIHLHSGGWTAQQDMNYIKLNQVADSFGFIVVYPSAIDKAWNSGGRPAPDVDDVGFINALIDIMSNSYSIDLERIYACGYSRGGFMAYTLACQLGHRIAAIASVSGVLSTSTAESCSPLRPVPVLHIHGTADTWVPINGGPDIYSADQTLSYWTNFNDCGQVDTTLLPDLDPTDGCTVEKTTYTDCSDNCNVVYYKVINGGHTWPGAGPPGYAAGNTNQDFNASLEIWNFFKNHKLTILSAVDFNGDEFIDINDLLIMIDNWSTDHSLCDIAPWPFGDGIVDALDLDLLTSYWRQETTLPPELTLVDNEETWTTKADMPTRRYALSSSVVDGKIYAMGGSTNSSTCIKVVEQYDPITDTWTRKADMPMINGAAATSVVNGRIYVIGGISGLAGTAYSSVIEYDPATDTWITKADMPTARAWVSSSVVNGKIYVIGGAVVAYGAPLSTVEEYDPATDTWTRKADMPTARSCLSTSAVNGKIYAIGGSSSNPYYQGLTRVEEYDPATDTWTRKADMPTGRTYISTCEMNGKIYAIGGVKSGGADHVSRVEEYDPATDNWTTKTDMPTARSGVATSAMNGKIYVIGGWVGTGSPISTVEEYDTGLSVPSPDFNGDGLVDIKDLLRLIQYWGQNNPMVDIAPVPFGDGVVDALDLELLMSYWGQEILLPPELITWKRIVDDFEQYTDDPPNEIFTTWVDGSGDPTNGATVGYPFPLEPGEHYVETTIVYNGAQSMPFFYDNTEALISEATRVWEVPQDWTREGVSELGLWFRGNPAAGSFTEGMDGTYTMTGSGADIWNNSDAFHFAYKQLTGPGTIIAKVESVDQTDDWAKAGVMIRETLDADSKHAMTIVTPAKGVSFQRRTSTGGASYHTTRAGISPTQWVKMERTASGRFIASYSGNGSSWTQLGTVNISMANTVYIGLAVTSHNSGTMCESVFTNASIEGNVSQETWTSQDIGITSNVAEPMYVALNGNAVIYHDDPNVALIDDWTLWRIDLQKFADQGVNLASVNLMTIGFGNRDNSVAGGEGHVFFDYIGLR